MPWQLFALPEVLAMMEAVGINHLQRKKFQDQAAFVLAKRPALTDADEQFYVASSYGRRTKDPMVKLQMGTLEYQLEVKKAREVAFMILEAAEAAVGDAAVITLLRDKVGITDETRLSLILLDLREIRQGSRDTVYPQ